ncbi:SMI1/KNR4 family protein [Streptomyces smaragdinus]|uniref:SMI1/KNR4 family protein n=1 Tax=Streptomyces smaragdinus TaxID=2585196 RepID=UPI001E63C18E|nr:SMI1/KNR4 family protein [Streptomyces smaragdinus]
MTFPGDFRELSDAYGAITINEHLYLLHPSGNSEGSLGEKIEGDIALWKDLDEEDLPTVGTAPGELLPISGAITGESVFLHVPVSSSERWRVGVYQSDCAEYVEYDMTFTDWLLAYLRGEDVTVCRDMRPALPFYTRR